MLNTLKLIGMIAFASGYLISPIDVIPDVILGPGQLDDLAVIVGTFLQMKHTLAEMRAKSLTHTENTR